MNYHEYRIATDGNRFTIQQRTSETMWNGKVVSKWMHVLRSTSRPHDYITDWEGILPKSAWLEAMYFETYDAALAELEYVKRQHDWTEARP